jgi:phosphatidylglycerol---prolipoprotein diacylglyceryl transferase
MTKVIATLVYPRINPELIRLGPLHVRWYGLAYLLGFLLAFAVLRRLSRRMVLRIRPEDVADLVSWLALGVVLGGRLGWWVFYHRSTGIREPWYEPIALWHGGMSFHGGLTGVLVALVLWSWKKRAPFWNLADCLALVTPFGLFFGRLANFINAELVGRPTTVPWGLVFPGDSLPRHPSQLYEAVLEGPILLLVLLAQRRMTSPKDGRTAAMFLICYGLFRFIVEFTREPDAQLGFIAFGWLTMGQLLSAVLVTAGAVLWMYRGSMPERDAMPRAA